MTPARLQTIEEIFRAALDQKAEQLNAFLDTACEGDELLRHKVTSLVASHHGAGNFIATSAVALATKIIENEQADLLVGQTIGHYKISSRIGTGGMGEVYLATDITAGRKAALKLLPARFTGDAERLTRFQQEARAVVALNHPNILTVYEIGEDHSTYYIASELIEGETLRQRLVRGGMELSEAVNIAIQVASALSAAHETGIVHRDVKPENIMLRPDGYVKVLDFGIAKLAEQEVPVTIPTNEALLLVETNLGSILGTVRYMSPEQARGAPVDQGTDIWSFGVVLYEMVTGHAPFTGETPAEAMHSILETEPPPLAHYIPQIPSEVQQIISKALRKDRAERYQSVHKLLQALQSLRRRMEFKAELGRSTSAGSWPRWITITTALLALATMGVGVVTFSRNRLASTLPVPEKSIAVLPFNNDRRDPNNAYFADGIQDEILTRLSKITELKVISRTSTQHYKSAPENLREIARQLGVAHILEGGVQKSGDAVRVNVQLIKAANDSHLWAHTFDRKVTDIFSVESEVAQKIAAALEVTLTGREKREISWVGTKNPQAYEAYLRGLTAGRPFDYDSWQRAVQAFEEAVHVDPQFAKAWALLGWLRARIYFQDFDRTQATRIAIGEAVQTAMRLDPELAEAQMASGFYEYYVVGDYDTARRLFEQVRSRWPNNADILATLGLIAFRQNRWTEGREYLDEAIALSPRDSFLREEAASTRASARDFPGALRTITQALAIWPDSTNLIAIKATVYQALGQLDQADALLSGLHPGAKDLAALGAICYQTMLRRDPAPAITLLRTLNDSSQSLPPLLQARHYVLLGQLEQLSGNTNETHASFTQARQTLEQESERQPQNPLLASLLAQTLAGLGQRDGALREADRAVELLPSSRDARDGPHYEAMRARIQARFGDGNGAIPTLKRLLQTRYSAWPGSLITPALLRLDPDFDQLRSDPRFQKLCE